MKKILLLFAAVGMLSMTSCTTEEHYDTQDTDTIAEVFVVNGVNFLPDSQGNMQITIPLNPAIYNSDMVLVYRNSGSNNGKPIWEPVPTNYSLAQGSLQYYFDFTVDDVMLYLYSDFDPALRPDFTRNQTFRVVIVPGFLSNKGAKTINTKDYNEVVKAFDIKESDVKEIKLK
ncbi:MAG: hypothetical protein ACLGH8_08725 [Bacteroidia bacterium]|jgi:hypothetical protein